MSKWIKTDVLLPVVYDMPHYIYGAETEVICKESAAVLVHHHDVSYPVPYCIAQLTEIDGDVPKWNEIETGDVINDVIAWMPIPAYEGDEK